jgi:hypothetical protein
MQWIQHRLNLSQYRDRYRDALVKLVEGRMA